MVTIPERVLCCINCTKLQKKKCWSMRSHLTLVSTAEKLYINMHPTYPGVPYIFVCTRASEGVGCVSANCVLELFEVLALVSTFVTAFGYKDAFIFHATHLRKNISRRKHT